MNSTSAAAFMSITQDPLKTDLQMNYIRKVKTQEVRREGEGERGIENGRGRERGRKRKERVKRDQRVRQAQ